MYPIVIDFPTFANDQKCTPTSTQGTYYCFYDLTSATTARHRATLVLNQYELNTVRIEEQLYNQGYDFSTYQPINQIKFYNEYTDVIFPILSIVSVFLIFYLIYRIMFRRFIK